MTEGTLPELDVLVGDWAMEALFPDAPPSGPAGRTVFEWMTGGQLLVQRWEVAVPEAPDGIAIIGVAGAGAGAGAAVGVGVGVGEGGVGRAGEGEGYLQHYFDSRGVVRVYEMTLSDGVWELLRVKPDFSPLDFCQRFTGRFSDDGVTIDGRWEKSGDGVAWEPDFDLRYTRI
jgi:hypothetical protein